MTMIVKDEFLGEMFEYDYHDAKQRAAHEEWRDAQIAREAVRIKTERPHSTAIPVVFENRRDNMNHSARYSPLVWSKRYGRYVPAPGSGLGWGSEMWARKLARKAERSGEYEAIAIVGSWQAGISVAQGQD